MDFEFDPNKSRKNKKKHGIDFIKAKELWNDPDRIEIPTKFLDEPRYVLIGKIDDVFWSAIFTYRGDKIRLISVRRARRNEREIYES